MAAVGRIRLALRLGLGLGLGLGLANPHPNPNPNPDPNPSVASGSHGGSTGSSLAGLGPDSRANSGQDLLGVAVG